MDHHRKEKLVNVLKEAGNAHHDYESQFLKGERDEYWAGWYAAFIIGRLGNIMSPTDLTNILLSVTSEEAWFDQAADAILTKTNNN